MRIIIVKHTGLLIFCGKKAKFRGIFRGKFVEKSADFVGFSREKSQKLRKNRPISLEKVRICGKIGQCQGRKVKIRRKIGWFRGILAGKSQISKDFRGKFIEKSADFKGKFSGKLCQETISKNNEPISLFFFLANFAKINQFCVNMTSVV